MRRGHRSAHLWVWLVLAVALPLGVGLALILRPAPPPVEPALDILNVAAGDA